MSWLHGRGPELPVLIKHVAMDCNSIGNGILHFYATTVIMVIGMQPYDPALTSTRINNQYSWKVHKTYTIAKKNLSLSGICLSISNH